MRTSHRPYHCPITPQSPSEAVVSTHLDELDTKRGRALASSGQYAAALVNYQALHDIACQRDVQQPQVGECDIGAVEYRPGQTTLWLWLPS